MLAGDVVVLAGDMAMLAGVVVVPVWENENKLTDWFCESYKLAAVFFCNFILFLFVAMSFTY